MSEPAVRLQQVTVRIGARRILDGIDLRVEQGERIALVGPNGAGKSTLLKLMTGIMQASDGRVEVLGRVIDKHLAGRELRSLRTDVGQVFQGLHLVQRLSTLENVLLGALARNPSWRSWARLFPGAEIARAEAALQAVGLPGKSSVRADQLSGGERQKTAIARLLMQAPRLVLADEPTAALDPLAAAEIARVLSSLGTQHGMTLVSVVHDPGLLPALAERVIGLRHGRIAFDLPQREVNEDCLAWLYRTQPDSGRWMARFSRFDLPLAQRA